ncbi:MAG: peptidyl-prolyl cis-trans isomerase [Verrucomicrobiales bacterium]|nr:peptidyl-prolyl cis-trans isomerase [Verrucomicrobiales bacterium]
MRWVKEPLIQFLAVGVILFAADALFSRSPKLSTQPASPMTPEKETIRVGDKDIEELRATYQSLWSRPPTVAELRDLVEQKVRDEVLYRHAIELGLDRDDAVVRRRLIQRVRFLTQDVAVIAPPDDAELQRHLEENPRMFASPPQVAFEQFCFSREARKEKAQAEAVAALQHLRTSDGQPVKGDEVPGLAASYPLEKEWNIADVFGSDFAEAVMGLSGEGWQGPVVSRFGFHLVRITQREEATLPPLEEVRDKVLGDYEATKRAEANEAYYQDLRRRYDVVIDEQALARPVEAATTQEETGP